MVSLGLDVVLKCAFLVVSDPGPPLFLVCGMPILANGRFLTRAASRVSCFKRINQKTEIKNKTIQPGGTSKGFGLNGGCLPRVSRRGTLEHDDLVSIFTCTDELSDDTDWEQ